MSNDQELELLDERYIINKAEIPDCKPLEEAEKEYKHFLDEDYLLWIPCEKDHPYWENSMDLYVFSARAAIAKSLIELGSTILEATENASIGHAIQYAHDEFFRNHFNPLNAIENIQRDKHELNNILKRWSTRDTELFLQGLDNLGKKFFKIRMSILPHKSTKDLVEFYYEWKWSKETKDFRMRYANLTKSGSRFPSIMRISNTLSSRNSTRRFSSSSTNSSNEDNTRTSLIVLNSLKLRKKRLLPV